MKSIADIVLRAVIIVVVTSLTGVGLNLAASRPLPLIYTAPTELTLQGVKVPLLDAKQARKLFDDGQAIFLDTRGKEDYLQSHVKGALLLPDKTKEEHFPQVQPLLPEESKIVLYCHGPDCEMAEHVAGFLVQWGYKNLTIMTSGFPAWEEAGYPVEKAAR